MKVEELLWFCTNSCHIEIELQNNLFVPNNQTNLRVRGRIRKRP